MNRIHHECAAMCQVKEHKGYQACDQTTGRCALLAEALPFDNLDDNMEKNDGTE